MDFGYAWISTYEENLQLQLDALEKAGCDIIREEKASGKAASVRPVQDAILRELKPGDTLTVWKLDRLGRSAADLEKLVTELEEGGVKSAHSHRTSTPAAQSEGSSFSSWLRSRSWSAP